MKLPALIAALSLALLVGSARAETPQAEVSASPEAPSASPKVYLSAFAGTTLLTRAAAGDVLGPSQDVTPMVGIGYVITDAWALELDLGPTFVASSGYSGLAVVPGVVFTVNSYLYLCGRLITTLHPTLAFAAEPGVGLTYTFKGGWAPFAELDAVILRNPAGGADLSAALAVGIAKYF